MLIIRAERKREVNSQVLLPAQKSECFKYVLGLHLLRNDGLWENTRPKRGTLGICYSVERYAYIRCVRLLL